MLVESDGPEAEVIHPVGMGGGDSLEDQSEPRLIMPPCHAH